MSTLATLAMSSTKNELMKHLNLPSETYTLMSKETDRVYHWLTSDKSHLKATCKRKPLYDWSDILEKSKDEAMKAICNGGDQYTDYYWRLAAPDSDGCPNWIARWFLYHKFRYRDGRNQTRVKSGEERKHRGDLKSGGQHKSHGHQLTGYEVSSNYYKVATKPQVLTEQSSTSSRGTSSQDSSTAGTYYDPVRDVSTPLNFIVPPYRRQSQPQAVFEEFMLDRGTLESSTQKTSLPGRFQASKHDEVASAIWDSPFLSRKEQVPDRNIEDREDDTVSEIVNISISSVTSVISSVFSGTIAFLISSISGLEGAEDQLVHLLIGDDAIHSLCIEALDTIGQERFERNLRRLLVNFAVELKKEGKTQQEQYAAQFVRIRARNTAHIICNTLKSGALNLKYDKGKSIAKEYLSDESGSDGLDNDLEDLQQLEVFVKSSQALGLLRESLRAFISPHLATDNANNNTGIESIKATETGAIETRPGRKMELTGEPVEEIRGVWNKGDPFMNGSLGELDQMPVTDNQEYPMPHLKKLSSFFFATEQIGKYATRLLQLDLANSLVKSDKHLFEMLRSNYQEMRGRCVAWFSLRTLQSIKFVQFELYGELVDVRKEDAIPPAERRDYKYQPAPPEFIPPVGDNQMMHLFQHPDHALDLPICLDRFPKKLKEKLKCENGVKLGWGLHFVEGWNTKSIWIIVSLIFGIGSLLMGVLWAVYGHSIQNAFAVAAYVVALAGVGIGTLQAVLVM
ncbi:uncharacterized protein PAC_17763 [Phialocephala subalpina]|uniref:Uncharacterized protein n=1 Tax=Phialocephala subalpina TaxID=576137 RepID=A0A1L7XS39_9HELO|nr:uncharacterized protein PAC_17763 [Phialocephala subalpina]